MLGDKNDWWRLFEGPDEPTPDLPKTAVRRPRGRPRTKSPPRIELPTYIIELQHRDGPVNITEDAHQEYLRMCEEDRREKAGDGIRKAFASGLNTANNDRHNVKCQRHNNIFLENSSLIFTLSLSSSAVARLIIKRGKNYGLGFHRLRKAVALKRGDPQPMKVGQAK